MTSRYKFVGELHFEADGMEDALSKLGGHFQKLAAGEVSHLLEEGSISALGEPELDPSLERIKLIDLNPEES